MGARWMYSYSADLNKQISLWLTIEHVGLPELPTD